MNGFLFSGLALLVILGAALPYVYLQQRKAQTAYQAVAKALGLQYRCIGAWGDPVLQGTYAGFEITVDAEVRRTRQARAHFTRATAAVAPPLPAGLSVTRATTAARVTRALGVEGIKVENATLDRELLVEGNQPDQVRAFLSDGQAAEGLLRFMRQGDDARVSAAHGIQTLKFGKVTNADELTQMINRVVSTATLLARPA